MNKLNRLEDTEKAIQESYDMLCGNSTLSENEILSKMDDEAWKNICVDMADCKRAVIDSKFCETNDVDEIWIEFKEHLQKKKSKSIWMKTAALVGLAATICSFIFLIARPDIDRVDKTKFFSASGSLQEITLKIRDGKTVSLENAVREGYLAEADTSWKAGREKEACHRPLSNNAETQWHCISVPRGKDFVLMLSDGTKVWLNAESQLEYPTTFTDVERTVLLSGEAYFDVASDAKRPFIVQTGTTQTHVLGTKFNVRNYENEELSITLVDGLVKVSNQESQDTILLHPNENLRVLDNGIFEKKLVDVGTYVSWTKGLFYFDNVSLDKIIYELGRWYDVDIYIDDESLLEYKLHYYCSRTDSLQKAMRLLSDLGHFQIVKENQAIIIR